MYRWSQRKAESDKPIATKFMIKYMFLILTLSNLIFSSISQLQIKVFAMGTICAPPCVKIFMGKCQSTHIYP